MLAGCGPDMAGDREAMACGEMRRFWAFWWWARPSWLMARFEGARPSEGVR